MIPFGTFSVWDALIILSIVGYAIYRLSIKNFDYWEKRGVPFVTPKPFVGNFMDVFLFRTTIGHHLAKIYNQFKAPYFGIYQLNTPTLVLKDPELIKAVMVKDFNYFHNRNVVCDEKLDSVASNMLFILQNPEWKVMRNRMTPVFSSGKIKNMYGLINGVAQELNAFVAKNLDKSFLEAKELFAKYGTNVIATCAFGINAHCFENENAEFRVIGRKIFDLHWKTALRQSSYFLAPILVKLFRMPFFDPTVSNFMREAIWATVHDREKNNHKRNDLVDMIIKIKDQKNPDDKFKFEGDKIVAQAAQFYAAGFETVSSTMAFTLYELSLQPNVQTRLRTEIKAALSKDGEISYESLMEMKYLQMVVCETLRKYPVLPFLDRLCMKDYKIPGSDFIIEKGTPVYIPLFGLHYDPEYFPNPDKFDPERFSDENKSTIRSFSYIPFGDGPRNCIGERFGLIAVKLGLVHLLSEYEVERVAQTPVPIQYETKSFLLASNVGLSLKFKKLVSIGA